MYFCSAENIQHPLRLTLNTGLNKQKFIGVNMSKQTLLKSDSSIQVQVDVLIFEEHGSYVAYCPALEVSSYGDTKDEAKKAFDGAMNIFIKETTTKGTLEKYLLKLGWQLQQKPKRVYQPPTFSLQESKRFLHKNPTIYNERVAMPA